MDKNQGYEIIQAVMLENGRGFALGHNPAAPSPYVTWACYDDKDIGCLPLDCECYMLGKCWTGAYCRYFRSAVLPLDPVLERSLTVETVVETRPCPVCGRAFPPDGRQRYCSPACAHAARQQKQRGYMRKYRG